MVSLVGASQGVVNQLVVPLTMKAVVDLVLVVLVVLKEALLVVVLKGFED